MEYDYGQKKIVAVLNSKLEPGIAMNVLGHLAVSIGYYAEDHMGRELLPDASNVNHLGISKYPVIVTRVKAGKLRTAIEQARMDKTILVADYPQEMLETGHDDELANALLARREEDILYLGAMFYGNSKAIDVITGRFDLWR